MKLQAWVCIKDSVALRLPRTLKLKLLRAEEHVYQVGDSRSHGSLIPPCAHLRDVVRHGEVSCLVMFSLIRIGGGGERLRGKGVAQLCWGVDPENGNIWYSGVSHAAPLPMFRRLWFPPHPYLLLYYLELTPYLCGVMLSFVSLRGAVA